MSGANPIEQAKETLPLPDLLAKLGLAKHAKKSARCPLHDDHVNSFSVYRNSLGKWRWKCFSGCGAGGEVDFIARLDSLTVHEAYRRYIDMARAGTRYQASCNEKTWLLPSIRETATLPAMPKVVSDAWWEGVDYLWGQPRLIEELAKWRGWSVEFAKYLSDCLAISMPRCAAGKRGIAFLVVGPEGKRDEMRTRPIGYHVRLKPGENQKPTWFFAPSERQHGTSIPALPFILGNFDTARLVVITEGQWDACTFGLAAGWLGADCILPEAVCLIGIRGVAGVDTFLRYYRPFWPTNADCLVLADNDPAGEAWHTGNNCFAAKLSDLSRKVAVVHCDPHKDFNDLYQHQPIGPEEITELLQNHRMTVETEVLA